MAFQTVGAASAGTVAPPTPSPTGSPPPAPSTPSTGNAPADGFQTARPNLVQGATGGYSPPIQAAPAPSKPVVRQEVFEGKEKNVELAKKSASNAIGQLAKAKPATAAGRMQAATQQIELLTIAVSTESYDFSHAASPADLSQKKDAGYVQKTAGEAAKVFTQGQEALNRLSPEARASIPPETLSQYTAALTKLKCYGEQALTVVPSRK